MTTAAQPVTTQTLPTMEERILAAIAQADQIVASFSPPAAALIAAGVETEPIISGFVHMFAALFRHHTSQPVAPPAAK